MYFIIYKITNNINNKIYIGAHKTSNKDDGYMGSGKILTYAFNKHGIENYSKEILFTYYNRDEMNAKEKELVNESFVARKDTYNIKLGGYGGWDYVNDAIKDDVQYKTKRAKAGRLAADIILREKHGTNWRSIIAKLGGDASRNTWESYSESEKQDRIIKQKQTLKENYPDGFRISAQHKEAISKANSIKQKGSGNSQYGKMWITNGTENKMIKKDQLMPDGFGKGRKII